MKNWIIFAGAAVLLYAYSQRHRTATVIVSDPIELPTGSSGPTVSDSTGSCNLCDTVSDTLGTDSRTTTLPQVDSPAADPIIHYAIDRLDFRGPAILAQ